MYFATRTTSLICAIILCCISARAASVAGGELSYECLGGDNYRITLTYYQPTAVGPALRSEAVIHVADLTDTTLYLDTIAPLVSATTTPHNISGCLSIEAGSAGPYDIDIGVYEIIINMPVNSDGYMIIFQMCCRNATVNSTGAGNSTATYTLEITREGLLACNNSPVFRNPPLTGMCHEEPFVFDQSAIDDEGDDIIYQFCYPLNGNLSPVCAWNGSCSNSRQLPPFPQIAFKPGFNVTEPMGIGAADPIIINSLTGQITGTPEILGSFTLTICIEEYRNGVLLSRSNRDFLFRILSCVAVIAATQPEYKSCSRTIDFDNLSVGAWYYFWDFGDGTTSFEEFPPPHTYPDRGTYTVNLTASNPTCADDFVSTVIIADGPTVDFTVDAICSGTDYQFTNLTTDPAGIVEGWVWDIEGNTYTDFEPLVTFNDTGVIDIVLSTMSDSFCVDTGIKQMIVLDSIVADVDIPDFNCSGNSITFVNNSTGYMDSILWDFGDGNTSTSLSPTHNYAANGQYTVDVTLFNAGCGDINYQEQISVVDLPTIDLGPDIDVCNGVDQVFTIDTTGIGNANILWSNGSNLPSVTVPGATATVWVEVDFFGCITRDSLEMTGQDSITLDVDLDNVYCGLGPISFTNNSTGLIEAVDWDFGDGNSSMVFSPSHTYATSGNYLVTLDLTNNTCGSKQFQQNIAVGSQQTIDLGPPQDICIGVPQVFSVDTTGFGPSTILWSTGENTTSVSISGGVSTLSVTIDNGCIIEDSVALTDRDSIVLDVTIPDNFCSSTSVNFINNSTGFIDSVLWDFGDGNTSTVSSPNHTYAAGGSYTVTIDLYNDICGSESYQQTINVGNPLVIDLGPPQDICIGIGQTFTIDTTGLGPTSILWSSGDTTPSVTISGGVPTLSVTVDNGCFATDLVNLTDRDSIIVAVTVPDNFCSGSNVNFINNSTGFIDSVLWDFGDGNTSTVDDPMHSYATGGSYTVTIDVFNNICGPENYQQTINVGNPLVIDLGPPQEICVGSGQTFTIDTTGLGQPSILWSTGDTIPSVTITGGVPTLSVTVDNGCFATDLVNLTDRDSIVVDVTIPDNFCSGSSVNFINNSTGFIDSVLWDFGDGNTSTLDDPTHSYAAGGSYTVTVDLYNNACGSKSHQQTINVGNPLIIDLGPPQDICLGIDQTFTIDTTGLGPHTILWSTGDTTPSVIINGGVPVLSVTVDNGCVATDLVNLTDRDSIVVDVIIPDNFCSGSNVNFINNSTGFIDSVLWDFGDGNTSTLDDPTHSYAAGGSYTVTIDIYNNACGPKSDQQTINVGNPLIIDLGPPQDICLGIDQTFTIDTTGLGPHTIMWSTGDTTPSVIINGGVPVLSVTVDNGCVATDLVNLTDRDSIIVNVTIPDNFCSGSDVNFFNNSTGFIDSVLWDFGDGDTSTLSNPTHNYTAGGSYTVTIILYNNICGPESYQQTINVGNPLIIDLGPPQDICLGIDQTFTIDTTGLGPHTIMWSTGDTTPSVVINGGVPVLSVTVDNGCVASDLINLTDRDSIIVNVTIPDNFCSGSDVNFFNNSTGFIDSVLWDFGDGDTSTLDDPTHNYAAGGSYTVTIDLYNNACGPESYQQTINVGNPLIIDLGPPQDICLGIDQTFTIDTTGLGPHTILWSTGDTTPSVIINGGVPVLSVTVDNGCVASDLVNLTDRDSIIVDVTIPDNFCSGSDVNFFNNSTGFIDSVLWDFGDGDTSTLDDPTHNYAAGGSYTVTIILYNNICGPETFQQTINVGDPLIIDLGPPQDICLGIDQTFTIDTTGLGPHTILWSTGDTTPSVIINGGVPVLSVTVDNGCVASDLVNLTDRDSIIVDVTIPDNFCSGSDVNFFNNSTGFIDSVLWDFGDGDTSTLDDPTHNYAAGGSYTVTIILYNNICGPETFQQTINVGNPLIIDLGPPQDICLGIDQTFTIDTTGLGPHTIMWSTGDTTPSVTISGGVPTLSVSVNNGCLATDLVNLTDRDSIIADVTFPDNFCSTTSADFINNSTGFIDSVLWDFGDGNTATTFSPTHTFPSGGQYTVSVDLFNGACGPKNVQAFVNVGNPPFIDLGPPQDLCVGIGQTFTVDTTGVGQADILWSTGDTTTSTFITGGISNLVVSVDNGCIAIDSVEITDKDSIDLDVTIPTSFCSTGGVDFINNSTGDIDSVLWDFGDGNTSTDFSPTHNYISGGSYMVTINIYNNACGSKNYQQVINIGEPPVIDLGPPMDLCQGVSQLFQIDTTGFGAASILWSTGDTTPYTTVTGGATDVSVAVDYFGCSAFDLIALTSSDSIVADVDFSDLYCNGTTILFNNNSTGDIDSVTWDFGDGNNSSDFSPSYIYTLPGSYTVVLDLFNSTCGDKQIVRNILISEPPNADLGNDATICNGVPYMITVDTTGNGPSSLMWSTGDTLPTIVIPPGLAELSVTVDNGCEASDTILISYTDAIFVDVDIPVNTCVNNTAAFVNNSTGTIDSVSWDFGDGNSSTTFSPTHTYITSGVYTVTIDLFNAACGNEQFSSSITVAEAPNASLGSDITVCNGIAFNITVDTTGNGPSSILWSTGDTEPTISVPPGLSELFVTIDNGCLASDTINVSYSDSIVLDVLVDGAYCLTDQIQFTNNSTGDIEAILWEFGDGDISVISNPTHTYSSGGTYPVTLTLFNASCGDKQFTQPVQISEPPAIDLGSDPELCQGVDYPISIDTTGFGSHTIQWSTGETTPDATITGGISSISVTVDNGCVANDALSITYRNPILVDVDIPDNACSGDSINFTNNSTGYIESVLWDFGDGNIATDFSPSHSYVTSGQYTVVLDLFNSACGQETVTEVIGVNNTPIIDLGPPQELCVGIPQLFSIDTTGFGGASILWSTGDTTPHTVVIGGAAQVSVAVDYFGCTALDILALTSKDSIVVDVNLEDAYCNINAISFNNNSTGDIESTTWDFGDGNGSNDFSPVHTYAAPGTYTVILNMTNATCGPKTFIQDVKISSPIPVDLGSPQQLCNGTAYNFGIDTTGFNGASIMWSTGETTPSVTITGGIFTLSVTVDNGCVTSDAITLSYLNGITPNVNIPNNLCLDNAVFFNNQSSGDIQSIEWNFGDGNFSDLISPTHTYGAEGVYQVTLEMLNDACGDVEIQENIRVLATPEIDLGPTVDVCDGEGATVLLDTTGFFGATVTWSTGDTGPETYVTEGNIIVTVTVDNYGCVVRDEVIISNECPIFIPTAFQPDGHNSTFNVINKNIEEYELRIYNRWGEQVFATSDFDFGWNGEFKGVPAEMDVYVWILSGAKTGGTPFTQSGTVFLLR